MLTCIIRYQIDPAKKTQFEQYARNWGQAIPRCGADLIGYYAPCEGSTTLAYGIYNIESLAEYEQYRQRLSEDPLAWIIHENAQFSLAPGMPDHFAHRIFCSLGNTVCIPLARKIPCEQRGRRDNRTFHE